MPNLNPENTMAPANGEKRKPSIAARLRSSALALVVANLAPLYGVLGLGWKVAPILVFYWMENLVVGFFNVLKMSRAQGPVGDTHMILNGKRVTGNSRKSLIRFFIFHYGIFTFGHLIFVMALFSPDRKDLFAELGMALLALSASHGYSYRHNFIGRGEYLNASFARLFFQPYKRMFAMHLTIIVCGVQVQSHGEPLGALLVLVALKTLIDLVSHWLEHKKHAS